MASSSGSAGPVPNQEGVYLPRDLVEAVQACKGQAQAAVCKWFVRGHCRKGNKCKLRHADDAGQALTLPRASFGRRPDGSLVMSLRPPLDMGWKGFFKEQPARIITGGQRRILSGGKVIIMYQVSYMAQGDRRLQTECRQRGSAGLLHATDKPFPDFMCHFCPSLGMGLSVLKAGVLHPRSEAGVCGSGGVEGAWVNPDQNLLDAVAETWSASAGDATWDQGCAFVLECNGCLASGKYSLVIPPGAISVRETGGKRLYSAHPSTFDVIAVVFDFEALVQALLPFMDPEYTQELHSSLLACQNWLHTKSSLHSKEAQLLQLANPITMEGGREVQEKQSALKVAKTEEAAQKKQRKKPQKMDAQEQEQQRPQLGGCATSKGLQQEESQGGSSSSQQVWHVYAPSAQSHQPVQQQHYQQWQTWWSGTWRPQACRLKVFGLGFHGSRSAKGLEFWKTGVDPRVAAATMAAATMAAAATVCCATVGSAAGAAAAPTAPATGGQS